MPKRKSDATSSISKKSKRTASKRYRSGLKLSKVSPTNYFTFERTFYLDQFVIAAGAYTFRAYSFQLDQLPNYTEFTNLFDTYHINFVKLRIDWTANSATAGATTTCPLVYSAIDFDDANAPTTPETLYQYGSFRLHNLGATPSWTRIIKPAVATPVYQSTIATSYQRTFDSWIDTGSPSVPHYGYKLATASPAASMPCGSLNLLVTMNFSCKDTR